MVTTVEKKNRFQRFIEGGERFASRLENTLNAAALPFERTATQVDNFFEKRTVAKAAKKEAWDQTYDASFGKYKKASNAFAIVTGIAAIGLMFTPLGWGALAGWAAINGTAALAARAIPTMKAFGAGNRAKRKAIADLEPTLKENTAAIDRAYENNLFNTPATAALTSSLEKSPIEFIYAGAREKGVIFGEGKAVLVDGIAQLSQDAQENLGIGGGVVGQQSGAIRFALNKHDPYALVDAAYGGLGFSREVDMQWKHVGAEETQTIRDRLHTAQTRSAAPALSGALDDAHALMLRQRVAIEQECSFLRVKFNGDNLQVALPASGRDRVILDEVGVETYSSSPRVEFANNLQAAVLGNLTEKYGTQTAAGGKQLDQQACLRMQRDYAMGKIDTHVSIADGDAIVENVLLKIAKNSGGISASTTGIAFLPAADLAAWKQNYTDAIDTVRQDFATTAISYFEALQESENPALSDSEKQLILNAANAAQVEIQSIGSYLQNNVPYHAEIREELAGILQQSMRSVEAGTPGVPTPVDAWNINAMLNGHSAAA